MAALAATRTPTTTRCPPGAAAACGSAGGVILVGIAGGTGSGKSTITKSVLKTLEPTLGRLTTIGFDNYYRGLSHLDVATRAKYNFDHPDALDLELLAEHLRALKRGETAEIPTYDFTTHTRVDGVTVTARPTPVVVVEGILTFADPVVRALMDIKIFVQTPADIRFIRRLKRDIAERGRTLDGVVAQYLTTVRPMHEQFVEPSMRHADVIVPEGGANRVAIDMIASRIGHLCQLAADAC